MIFDSFNLFNRVNFKEVNSNTNGSNGVLRLSDLGITDSVGDQNRLLNGFQRARI